MKNLLLLSIALMFAATISKAQPIPNAGFENWTNTGNYFSPDSWETSNNVSAAGGVYTAEQGTPGSPGSYYLKLTSKTVSGQVVNGMAVCGHLDPVTMQPVSGFPFSQRPSTFTGKWQHMIFGSSQGSISVTLTRWDSATNTRVTVATAQQTLTGMAMNWANFTLGFTYTDGYNPDSCLIVLKASGTNPTNSDYLWVDNLSFGGNITGISTPDFDANISIYPNPTSHNLSMDLSALQGQGVTIQIFDPSGRQIQSSGRIIASSTASLDISALSTGNYMLNIITDKGTVQRSFIKK